MLIMQIQPSRNMLGKRAYLLPVKGTKTASNSYIVVIVTRLSFCTSFLVRLRSSSMMLHHHIGALTCSIGYRSSQPDGRQTDTLNFCFSVLVITNSYRYRNSEMLFANPRFYPNYSIDCENVMK